MKYQMAAEQVSKTSQNKEVAKHSTNLWHKGREIHSEAFKAMCLLVEDQVITGGNVLGLKDAFNSYVSILEDLDQGIFYKFMPTFDICQKGCFLIKKGVFLKKGHPKFHPPLFNPFPSKQNFAEFSQKGAALDGRMQCRSRIYPVDNENLVASYTAQKLEKKQKLHFKEHIIIHKGKYKRGGSRI